MIVLWNREKKLFFIHFSVLLFNLRQLDFFLENIFQSSFRYDY